MDDFYWMHVWQSSEVLGAFIAANAYMFEGVTALEIGAGCSGIPGITAVKCGANKVILTDNTSNTAALELLDRNCVQNGLNRRSFVVKGIDWNSADVDDVMNGVDGLSYIFAADVFYNPSVFQPIIHTVAKLLQRYPQGCCLFAYEERDCNWNIEDLLVLNELRCRRVRSVQTDLHTIHIGIIYSYKLSKMATKMFAGIEGGATQSKLVILDDTGKIYGEWIYGGLNYTLDGFDTVADRVAAWIRKIKKEIGVSAPLAALGMGLSGAEDEEKNKQFIRLLKEQHGDIAFEYFLSSDAVVAVAAAFEQGGVVIIAGTGSSCRLLKQNGTIYGVGGWGHEIGDGGSAYWIARRIIQSIFDEEDGFIMPSHSAAHVKKLFLDYFQLDDKIGILQHLYTKFDKPKIAAFTEKVVKDASSDPFVKDIFFEAGELLGRHLRAISKHFDSEMYENVPVLLIGSVWRSWFLLKDGFLQGLEANGNRINQITLYTLTESPAMGAAVLAAKKMAKTIVHPQFAGVVEVLQL